MSMDYEDKAWAIVAEIADVPIEGRIERLVNDDPFVRVLLDDLYVIDCQPDPNSVMEWSVHVRRYDLDGNIVYDKVPYQAAEWKMAAKCIELCHRVHEVSIRDNMERLEYALRLM
jgi:hypothetical protein